MKYRELLEKIKGFDEYQLDCYVTVEDPHEDECYPSELRIAGSHHSSLDENHPVIYMEN